MADMNMVKIAVKLIKIQKIFINIIATFILLILQDETSTY